nr:MAG TPA: hypothetical protein [Caudoviricetes sp.]
MHLYNLQELHHLPDMHWRHQHSIVRMMFLRPSYNIRPLCLHLHNLLGQLRHGATILRQHSSQ